MRARIAYPIEERTRATSANNLPRRQERVREKKKQGSRKRKSGLRLAGASGAQYGNTVRSVPVARAPGRSFLRRSGWADDSLTGLWRRTHQEGETQKTVQDLLCLYGRSAGNCSKPLG